MVSPITTRMIAVSAIGCGGGGRRKAAKLASVLQHVSIEIVPDEAEAAVAFWRLLGFERVDSPEALGGHVTWVERQGTQIHLIHTDGATVPVLGHAAVVVDDFEAALGRVRDADHEVEETRELWGARRAFAIAPGGHRVELMEYPP
jgi:catechol 2,3-dioxygenase-like lactoylglutathione lyase family enzyme